MVGCRNSVLEQALKATWEILSDKKFGMPELIEAKVCTFLFPFPCVELLKKTPSAVLRQPEHRLV